MCVSSDLSSHADSVERTPDGCPRGRGWGSKQKDSTGVEWYPGNYGDFVGIAPNANIIAIKAIDSNGVGTTSNVVSAIDYCVSNKSKYNINSRDDVAGGPDAV